jgi:hypothetical protein
MEIKAILTKVTVTYWDDIYTVWLTIGADAVAMAQAETQAEAYEKLQMQMLSIGDLIGWAIPEA